MFGWVGRPHILLCSWNSPEIVCSRSFFFPLNLGQQYFPVDSCRDSETEEGKVASWLEIRGDRETEEGSGRHSCQKKAREEEKRPLFWQCFQIFSVAKKEITLGGKFWRPLPISSCHASERYPCADGSFVSFRSNTHPIFCSVKSRSNPMRITQFPLTRMPPLPPLLTWRTATHLQHSAGCKPWKH